jgi:hypothetical protein
MKAVRKTILFLGVAVILLGIPPTAAAENDDTQAPQASTLVAGTAAISPRARGTVQPRVQLRGEVLPAPCTTSVGHAAESVSDFVFRNCRSILQSFCSRRC